MSLSKFSQQPRLARSELKDKSTTWAFHMGDRNPVLGPSSSVPTCSHRTLGKKYLLEFESGTRVMDVLSGDLNCCMAMPNPHLTSFWRHYPNLPLSNKLLLLLDTFFCCYNQLSQFFIDFTFFSLSTHKTTNACNFFTSQNTKKTWTKTTSSAQENVPVFSGWKRPKYYPGIWLPFFWAIIVHS